MEKQVTEEEDLVLNSFPEKRWAIIGSIDGKFYTGIYTKRAEKIRLISVRRSQNNEEKYYEKYFK